MQYTPVIPPLPSPEGGQSSPQPNPPVIPTFSPQSPQQSLPWMRGPGGQPGYAAPFPPGMYQQTPYLAVPTLPGQATPNSYYLAPTQLPPSGGGHPGPQMAPVGPSGFSADWTGFPITTTVPPQGTPWQAPAQAFPGQQQQGFPGQPPPQAPPGTGFNMFQQPLPLGAFMHPAYAAMMQTPFMGAGAMPQGQWPGAFAGAPPGFGGGPAPGGPAAPPSSHPMPPSRVAESFDKFDKFSEEPWCTYRAYHTDDTMHVLIS